MTGSNNIPTKNDILRELFKRSYYYFLKWNFENVYNRVFIPNWHHELMCQKLEDVFHGKIKRLVITVPPRYSKSEIAMISFVAWCYTQYPDCNFIHTSYSGSLARRNSNATKEIIIDQNFHALYPLELSKTEFGKERWRLKQGGQVYATSAGGRITGEGAGIKGVTNRFGGCLIVDDPSKVDSERYEVQLGNVIENFEYTQSTRLNNPSWDAIIVIMQRIHENDLAGFLLSGKSVSGKYEHLNLPAIAETTRHPKDPRKEGDALWPGMHSIEKLEEMQKKDPWFFAGQYQQRPSPREGGIIKKEWLKEWTILPKYPDFKLISCDLNFHKGGGSYACYSVYLRYKKDFLLIDRKRGKWSFVESKAEMKSLISRHWDYRAIVIENKANGPALISSLIEDGISKVIPWPPKGEEMKSKQERLHLVSPLYQAGNVFYPKRDMFDWVPSHIQEILNFGGVASINDDAVDCESQALTFLDRQCDTFFKEYRKKPKEISRWRKDPY